MRGKSITFACVLAASLVGALTSVASAADDPTGPPIGNNKYRTVIQDVGGEQDVDDYVQRFVKGEVLTVEVTGLSTTAAGQFLPILELVDPDGLSRFADVLYSRENRVASLDRFTIDKAGTWAARISGRDGDQGSYVVAFRVKPVAKVLFANQRLGNDQPFSRTHYFSAFGGARLDARLVYDRRGLDVVMRSLADPAGAEVLEEGVPVVERAAIRRQVVTLNNVTLTGDDGEYSMRVRIPTADARYSVTFRVNPGVRPSSKKIQDLSPAEPVLDARQFPLAGEPGDTLTLTGINFATGTPAPRVVFGDNAAENVLVASDGRSLTCAIPPRGSLAVVSVSVTNPDGQVSVRPVYFAYVPAPVINDFIEVATGQPLRQAGTSTLKAARIEGENLLPGQLVSVGTVSIASYTVNPAGTEITFTLPVMPQGTFRVSVSDEFGRSATSEFEVYFKTPPAFAATNPYSPGALKLNTAGTVTIRGTGFDSTDVFEFRGVVHPSAFIDSSTRTFDVPALTAGSYSVAITDSIGTRVAGPNLDVKLPPNISAVSVIGAPVIGTSDIPLGGGATIQVDGSDFGGLDALTLGGVPVTQFVQRTPIRVQFIAPAANAGPASLVITDGAGQSASRSNVVNYVGFADATAARKDPASATDSFSAVAGAAADFDGDGQADDVLLTSEYQTQIGTRRSLARLLLGDATGKLKDVSSTRMPGPGADSTGTETFDATVIAIGDVDRSGSQDAVIGGFGAAYYSPYYGEVRVLKNVGGTFVLDEGMAPPSRYEPSVQCIFTYYGGYTMTVYNTVYPQGTVQAVALGDLDRDGDVDLVAGFSHYDAKTVRLDPKMVDFSQNPPVFLGYYYYAKNYLVNYTLFRPATRLYENRISTGAGMIDQTKTRLPSAGDSKTGSTPRKALHCSDLALADIDLDGDTDLIVAWNDPTTTTPAAMKSKDETGTSTDSPKVATTVLLNNGTGVLTSDATASWMPLGGVPEFWQADRILLDDLDADGDPDLLLLCKTGLDAYTGSETHNRSALRVLRNDRTRFVDVTVSALPTVNSGSVDDFRGETIAVRDVNGDGRKDIVIGTTEDLRSPSSQLLRRTRLLAGTGTLRWSAAAEFMAPIATDSGEAKKLLFVRDLGGAGASPLMLLSDVVPAASPSGERSRVLDWKK